MVLSASSVKSGMVTPRLFGSSLIWKKSVWRYWKCWKTRRRYRKRKTMWVFRNFTYTVIMLWKKSPIQFFESLLLLFLLKSHSLLLINYLLIFSHFHQFFVWNFLFNETFKKAFFFWKTWNKFLFKVKKVLTGLHHGSFHLGFDLWDFELYFFLVTPGRNQATRYQRSVIWLHLFRSFCRQSKKVIDLFSEKPRLGPDRDRYFLSWKSLNRFNSKSEESVQKYKFWTQYPTPPPKKS